MVFMLHSPRRRPPASLAAWGGLPHARPSAARPVLQPPSPSLSLSLCRWGSVVVSVLFWGFANQITTVDEAKQFYPLFGLGANVALIFSGRAVKIFSQVRPRCLAECGGCALQCVRGCA